MPARGETPTRCRALATRAMRECTESTARAAGLQESDDAPERTMDRLAIRSHPAAPRISGHLRSWPKIGDGIVLGE